MVGHEKECSKQAPGEVPQKGTPSPRPRRKSGTVVGGTVLKSELDQVSGEVCPAITTQKTDPQALLSNPD